MSDASDTGPEAAGFGRLASPLRTALLESRQRFRDLVTMCADFAFETDARGRIVFVTPDPALGWPASMLLDQPAELLLAQPPGAADLNPFRPDGGVRRQRVWLRRAEGTVACLSFAAAPLLDRQGDVIGARGLGIDVTEPEDQSDRLTAVLRRTEAIDRLLAAIRAETQTNRMIEVALQSLISALDLEGAALVGIIGGGPAVLHEAGTGASEILGPTVRLLRGADPAVPVQATTVAGRAMLLAPMPSRYGAQSGLTLWRLVGLDDDGWDIEHGMLAGSAASILRMVLDHEAILHEMALQARTDPLTKLLNRRGFVDELPRHIERLERESLPGTLMLADLDLFRAVNEELGYEVGDKVLEHAAELLRRTVRPTDLVARLGGDQFALWLNGADHLTAAERAERLRTDFTRRIRRKSRKATNLRSASPSASPAVIRARISSPLCDGRVGRCRT